MVTGSPPPMRGKGRCIFPLSVSKGITPAYAGKSYMENAGMTDAMRITPAYAGKRWKKTVSCTGIWDHPRLCGEKISHALLMMLDRGSPPPMRGKVVRHTHTQDRFRITPAYAGKSSKLLSFSLPDQDHPRLCGEKYVAKRQTVRILGSPPPMRGKEICQHFGAFRLRITPAYAGKR